MTDVIAKTRLAATVTAVREEIRRVQAMRATKRTGSQGIGERSERATEADMLQPEQLDTPLSPEEKQQMEANLRGLAVALKREGESDEDAYQRVLSSRFLITYRDDQYWPFYHVEHKFGRVILTINTAHPFFEHLYKPLRELRDRRGGRERESTRSGCSQQQRASGGPWNCFCCRWLVPRACWHEKPGMRRRYSTPFAAPLVGSLPHSTQQPSRAKEKGDVLIASPCSNTPPARAP